MKRLFKFFLVVIAIAMLSIVGCEKGPTGSDDPNDGVPPISFTLSSVLGVTLPDYYVVDSHVPSVTIFDAITGSQMYHFSVRSGTTRVFTGDSAKIFLGQNVSVGTSLKVYDKRANGPYLAYLTTPSTPLRTKVEKSNIFSFSVTGVQGISW